MAITSYGGNGLFVSVYIVLSLFLLGIVFLVGALDPRRLEMNAIYKCVFGSNQAITIANMTDEILIQFLRNTDMTSVTVSIGGEIREMYQKMLSNTWMYTNLYHQEVKIGTVDEIIYFIHHDIDPMVYRPTERGNMELTISLADTDVELKVVADNIHFLKNIVIGYVMADENLVQADITLWGQTSLSYKRRGPDCWQMSSGHEDILFETTEAFLEYLVT